MPRSRRLSSAGRRGCNKRVVHPLGKTGDVSAARRIDGHAAPFVPARASEVARIHQRRIDDERLRAIVVADREAHLTIRPQDERTDDVDALLADVLDRPWRCIDQLTGAERAAQLTVVADAEKSSTIITQPDARGVGTRLHAKLVLQGASPAEHVALRSRRPRDATRATRSGRVRRTGRCFPRKQEQETARKEKEEKNQEGCRQASRRRWS